MSYRSFALLLLLAAIRLPAQNILQYRAVLQVAEPVKGGNVELAIRMFTDDTVPALLLVNPDSLTVRTAPAQAFRRKSVDWDWLYANWAEKPYIKALAAAHRNDVPLTDAGITRLGAPETGIYLTADLCPSLRPMDRRIFTALAETAGKEERPVPVTLCISGMWLRNHREDMTWLKEMAEKGELRITWANHTLHHHWDPKLPLDQNFLLEKGTNLETEVLGNEELLLENGVIPSAFFRFPGLVSDRAVADKVLDWGLIPIGSDAWLAKGQHPQASGSIVLIHANGNEPVGVDDFLRLLTKEKDSLQRGQWRLLDLREKSAQE